MLTYIPIVEHSWNIKLAYLHGAGHLCTQRKRMSFSLMVSVALTLQEGPFHVMFVRKQHTHETKELKVCDWNHLSLSVIVPAKPTSRRDCSLELTQSNFAAQTKTCECDGQNATKVTSALTDTCIQFLGPVMSTLVKTLCSSLVLMAIFSHSVLPSFFSQLL